MKAVLVFDEMPRGCVDCPCFDIGDTDIMLCNVRDPYRIKDMFVRPSWCPLKKMPEQIKGKYTLTGIETIDRGYVNGWNDCLEEIENETD
jgi:hypothetical protein